MSKASIGIALITSFVGLSPVITAAPAAAEPPRIGAPVTHDSLTIYLLHGPSSHAPVPLTLSEALANGAIEVKETGNVRELKIANKGNTPVFVQLGDIVKGGWQDRVLAVSLQLAPNSGHIPIGAYCVESGRWSARGNEDAQRFALSEAMLPSRDAKLAIARTKPTTDLNPSSGARPPNPNVAPIETELNAISHRQAIARLERHAQATPPGAPQVADALAQRIQPPSGLLNDRQPTGQVEVWRNIDVLQRLLSNNLATSVASETSRTSLQLSLENERLKAALTAFLTALEPAGLGKDAPIGVAFAIGGRLTSADIYPSNGLFRKMWPKLLRAAATEAIAHGAKPVADPPAVEAVAAFLVAADSAAPARHDLATHTIVETRESDSVLVVTARSKAGDLVHRSHLAK